MFVAFVIDAAFCLSLAGFLIMHARLVAANCTTIEMYEKRRTPDWPYNRGARRNFQDVFGSRRGSCATFDLLHYLGCLSGHTTAMCGAVPGHHRGHAHSRGFAQPSAVANKCFRACLLHMDKDLSNCPAKYQGAGA